MRTKLGVYELSLTGLKLGGLSLH